MFKHDKTKLEKVEMKFSLDTDLEKPITDILLINAFFYQPTRFEERTL